MDGNRIGCAVLSALLLVACTGLDSAPLERRADAPDPVLVLGTIHSGHESSENFGLDVLAEMLRAYRPDFVLTEIPPDRFHQAAAEFAAHGTIQEARVSRFPEYTQVIFPLQQELGYEIVPCAGWTRKMAEARSAKLIEWRTSRAAESAEVQGGMDAIEARCSELGLADDPAGMHLQLYDEVVRAGLEPYDRLFNDDLGPGGWSNINTAHWNLIAAALDEHVDRRPTGERRFLVTFGAWHKYWILDQLGERSDVRIEALADYWPDPRSAH